VPDNTLRPGDLVTYEGLGTSTGWRPGLYGGTVPTSPPRLCDFNFGLVIAIERRGSESVDVVLIVDSMANVMGWLYRSLVRRINLTERTS